MKQINFQAPICYTGYGVAAFNIANELSEISDLTLFPIGNSITVFFESAKQKFIKLLEKQNSYNFRAPTIKMWHSHELRNFVGGGKFLPFPFFELDTFDDISKHSLRNCSDTIIVASNWAKEIIEKNNINTPCVVVPLGVDMNIFDHKIEPKNKNSEKYIFSMIGKWEIRKGHDILLDIFHKAFPGKEDVELWISASSDNGYIQKQERLQWENMYLNSPLGEKVVLCQPVDTHQEMAEFISNIDCGIYISRAEGWNLELLETMAMNKPVIASNYSAHTEFCNSDNSFLFDIHETEPAIDGKFFRGQGNWAKIGASQIDTIVDHLRFLYKNNIRTNPNGVETGKKFSWKNSAEIINSVL